MVREVGPRWRERRGRGGVMGRVVERSAVAVAEEQTTEAAAAEVAGRGRW